VLAAVTDPAILEGYLRDASNLRGRAEALYRPRSAEEVAEVFRAAQAAATPLTITARRTSTTGAPVPLGGALLSTEALCTMHALDDVDGGVLLGEYQARVEAAGRFFPPDPTSRHECSVGGAIACNASGARSFKYGPIRPWVREVEAVLANGEIVRADRSTPLPWPVPQWEEPRVKTAAGLYPAQNLLDLLIGSEGILGLITRARTELTTLPSAVLTLFAFLPTRESLQAFLPRARALGPRCIESFDRRALELIRGRVPEVPNADCAVLLEIEHEGEPPLEPWWELLGEVGALVDDTLVVTDDAGRAKLHAVRHALPATVNEIIARNGVQKVGTDFSVPADRLGELLALYDAVPMPSVCFGHIGDSHLHLNLLPRNAEELERARALYFELAQAAVAMGGSVSGEHGIGRLKVKHLALMAPPALIEGWRQLKRRVDPAGILAPGVMFDP
jgi:FAD/FMN-containing dehydrogenase